jgi:ABC-2 type transport system permease protein
MSTDVVVTRVTARRAGRSAAVWGAVFAVYLAVSALGYAASYPTQAERDGLATGLGANAGLNAILGPAHRIDTVAGFTEWRGVGLLSLIAAGWGVLVGTRLLRGEEAAGRWELLLAGRTTRRRAAAEALAGLGIGAIVLWLVPALATAAIGRSATVRFPVGGSLLLVLAPVLSAAIFLLVGALAAQLAPTRRQAAALAGAVLAIAYALRAVADAGVGVTWLRWWTPLGWAEQLRPLSGPDPIALVPVAISLAVLGMATVSLAGSRDLGASALPDRDRSRPATGLLGGTTALTVRLLRPLALGWAAALLLTGALFGAIAKTAGDAIEKAAGFRTALQQLGLRGGVGARLYLAVAFLIVAVLVALIATTALAALRGEEAEGRLDHLLSRPVARSAWLLGRVAAAVALAVVGALLATVAAWLGTAATDAGVAPIRLAEAGVNVLPPALLVLGVGVLVYGMRPRAATPTCYALIAWSFLVQLIGSIVKANHWLLDTSVFRHMSAAPAVAPNWAAAAALTGLGVLAAAVGMAAFLRRDLAGE